MSKESTSKGAVNFTLLFVVFIVVFGVISLLMNNVSYILLSISGLAIGLVIKGGEVNVLVRILLARAHPVAQFIMKSWFHCVNKLS